MEQAKLKTSLRRTGARSHQALQEAIVQVQKTIKALDARGWFDRCANLPAPQLCTKTGKECGTGMGLPAPRR